MGPTALTGLVCYKCVVPRDVVLLPSLGRPARDFADLQRRLETGGFSAHAMEPCTTVEAGTTLHDLAGDVVSRLAVKGIDRFHLIGHAFGNRLARSVSADFPDRVASLTLLAAGGHHPPSDDITTSLHACFDTTLTRREHLGHVGKAFFAPGHDPSVWASGWMPAVAACQAAAVRATPLHDWWDAVAPRVLVIQGLDDLIAPPLNGRHYVEEHSEVARLVELHDAGHALIVEQPEVIGDTILQFLLEGEEIT